MRADLPRTVRLTLAFLAYIHAHTGNNSIDRLPLSHIALVFTPAGKTTFFHTVFFDKIQVLMLNSTLRESGGMI
ncbi:hypothetical protein BRC19_01850 [Candidatus Saccharibacteria bacterium QS_5_54_17]|nr:MAG: hypothetical protein BRC19_01850 [Candidatus Saccharibacteria bacterium QS_5_54_17]